MHRIATKLLTATITLTFLTSWVVTAQAQQDGTKTRPIRLAPPPRGTKSQTRKRTPAGKVQQAAAAKRAARPRANAVMKQQKPSPEMVKFLQDWEVNSAKHQRLEAKVEIYIYDTVFFTEQRGIAEIKFEFPDKASYEVKPMDVSKMESKHYDPEGKPYSLSGMAPERWVCTGKEIFQIDDTEKTFSVIPIPPEQQGERISDGPIPFLFGLKAEDAQKRYNFYQIKPTKNIPNVPNPFWFAAIPLRQVDRQEYKRAFVILDVDRYVPSAIQLTDPTGNTQKTYNFTHVDVNPKYGFLGLGNGAFIDPKLKGYKWVKNTDVGAPNAGGPARRQAADIQPGDARPRVETQQPGRLRISGGQDAGGK